MQSIEANHIIVSKSEFMGQFHNTYLQDLTVLSLEMTYDESE